MKILLFYWQRMQLDELLRGIDEVYIPQALLMCFSTCFIKQSLIVQQDKLGTILYDAISY